ncbi:MAG: PIN domain-containing protein [Alphaproteobacteria bacterium]
MTYIDSSVALAYLLAEPRSPAVGFWDSQLVASRLLEYEMWTRLYARQVTEQRRGEARMLLAGIQMMELSKPVLARALEPWPAPIRTLDALHLATADYLRRHGEAVELASYDDRLLAGARALGIPLAAL